MLRMEEIWYFMIDKLKSLTIPDGWKSTQQKKSWLLYEKEHTLNPSWAAVSVCGMYFEDWPSACLIWPCDVCLHETEFAGNLNMNSLITLLCIFIGCFVSIFGFMLLFQLPKQTCLISDLI